MDTTCRGGSEGLYKKQRVRKGQRVRVRGFQRIGDFLHYFGPPRPAGGGASPRPRPRALPRYDGPPRAPPASLPTCPPDEIGRRGRGGGRSPRSFRISMLSRAGVPNSFSSNLIPPSPPWEPGKLATIAFFAASSVLNSRNAHALLRTISYSLIGPNC